MKTSIIYLGVAIMITTSSIANNRNFINVNSTKTEFCTTEIEQGDSYNSDLIENKKLAPVEDQTIINPESILNVSYQKNIEAVILEDNKITESTIEDNSFFIVEKQSIEEIIIANNQIIESENTTEVLPLYLERTIEDAITENNTIIENELNTTAKPLDFEKINKVQTFLKKDKLLF